MTKKLSRQISLIILIVMAFFCLACSLSACSGDETSESDHIHTYNIDNVCTECGYELNYTEGLTYYLNDDEYFYFGGNTKKSSKVTIAAYYNGLPVTTVMLMGQNGIENLTMTLMANGILKDEDRFEFVETYYGDSITEITIPDGVTTVEFSGNEKIKTANLSQTVTSLTIDYCENITTVNTPSSLSYISISNCDKLKTKTQDGITYLDTCVLSCDDDLEKAEIREGTTAIYKYAFEYCESLSEVTIPDSVNYIGTQAFYCCNSLENITVNSGNSTYKSIDGNLYNSDGTKLILYAIGKTDKEFTTPEGVTSIGSCAFYNCQKIKKITLSESVTSIDDDAFIWCESLSEITIPESVTYIGGSAFAECYSLNNIIIPDSITTINSNTFYNCISLTNITIPDSVTCIDYRAFYWCDALTSVTFKNTSGWFVTETSNAASGTDVDVTNANDNAAYLTDTYSEYYWYRSKN